MCDKYNIYKTEAQIFGNLVSISTIVVNTILRNIIIGIVK